MPRAVSAAATCAREHAPADRAAAMYGSTSAEYLAAILVRAARASRADEFAGWTRRHLRQIAEHNTLVAGAFDDRQQERRVARQANQLGDNQDTAMCAARAQRKQELRPVGSLA